MLGFRKFLRFKGSLNLFQGFGNNPVNFVDPFGEQALKGISHEAILSAYRQFREQGYSEDEALKKLEEFGFIGSDRTYKMSIVVTAKTRPVTAVMETVAYVGSGFIPIVGEVQDITALVTGYDPLTMERFTTGERLLSGVGLMIPFVSGATIRKGITKADDVVRVVRKTEKAISPYVRKELPELPKEIERAFEGPVRIRTFKAGQRVYRSPQIGELAEYPAKNTKIL